MIDPSFVRGPQKVGFWLLLKTKDLDHFYPVDPDHLEMLSPEYVLELKMSNGKMINNVFDNRIPDLVRLNVKTVQ